MGDGAIAGDRLVEVAAGYYHTRRDSGVRFEPQGQCGDGACYWVGRAPDGTKLYFGGDAQSNSGLNGGSASAVWEPPTSLFAGRRGIDFWSLHRVEDRHGNFYDVHYLDGPGTLYPETIEYTKHASLAGVATRVIQFGYELRPDPTRVPARMTRRLRHIRVTARGEPLDCHRLE